ncbi:hypothetical protein KEJ47_09615 [Candidatus Bathyarchaeota archaeon]|nr:hypothetical protein [Candidatus Bathyarchaeota archaeon]
MFQALPKPEKIIRIKYEYQENRQLIGTDEFNFDEDDFQRNCSFVEEFWLGKRRALSVGIRNSWKCNYCEFCDICENKPIM